MAEMLYISREGALYGPYEVSALQKYVSDGSIIESDFAWDSGREQWRPVLEVIGSVPEGEVPAVASVNSPFLADLAARAARYSRRQITMKARALFEGAGFFQRSETTVRELHRQLEAYGLTTTATLDTPADLNGRVAIRLVGSCPTPTRPSLESSITSQNSIENAIRSTLEVIAPSGTGTGFVVHPDGLVVTAHHVVEEEGRCLRTVKVRLYPETSNERVADATVFRAHRVLDFALLWIDAVGTLPWIPLGDPTALKPAQTVYAIGCPGGLPCTITRGIVGNPNAKFKQVACVQTDAAIDHGNSGGPLITEDGRAVGVTLWGLGEFDAAKFVVPIDYLTQDIETALAQGRRTCLEAGFCPSCGWTEHGPAAWFCRNCGSEMPNRNT